MLSGRKDTLSSRFHRAAMNTHNDRGYRNTRFRDELHHQTFSVGNARLIRT